MTEAEAIRFCNSRWYEGRSPEEIAALQLYEKRLVVPEFGIFHGAVEDAIGRPVQTIEFGLNVDGIQRNFETAVPDATGLIERMRKIKEDFIAQADHNKIYDFEQQISKITKDRYWDIYTSPDFQCDQTEGIPASLCVCWEKGKAWLELNESLVMDRDETELNYYRQCCADFGIRSCYDEEDFNRILKELGEDAYQTAYLPSEDEGMELHP